MIIILKIKNSRRLIVTSIDRFSIDSGLRIVLWVPRDGGGWGGNRVHGV
jgi:hypothetical protein